MLQRYLDTEAEFEKSPKIEGLVQGGKAALLAAPLGAAVQALRGKSPAVGGAAAGFGAGILIGLAAAAAQKFKNMQTEAQMKYHIQNISDDQPQLTPMFSRGFENVRNPY